MKQIAVRNLRLCTKDCLCLYVCPVGATDTENSIIDADKCLGCGVCAKACPSGAISMVPAAYPPQQKKAETVTALSFALAKSKARQEKTALQLAETADNDGLYRLMKAFAKSVRLVNEDLLRESGYMLPQSGNARNLLQELVKNPPSDDFPAEAAEELLELIPCNEKDEYNNKENERESKAGDDVEIEKDITDVKKEAGSNMKKYKCKICGAIFEVPDGEEPVCPVCKARGENLELIEGRMGEEANEEEQIRQVPCTECNNGEAYMVGDPPEGVNTQTFRSKCCPASGVPYYIPTEAYEKWQHLHYTDAKAEKIRNNKANPNADLETLPALMYTEEESEIINQVQASLITEVNRITAEWVMNGNIDEQWDSYLETLKSMRMEELVNATQTAYDRFLEASK